tara:strand:+ start:359 stop:688 length:330 start_codon:yes stop_codon:yes gene_type:complete
MSDETEELEILKQVVGELRALNERIAFVEHENYDLRKTLSNPDELLQKAGWLRVSTPHAAEIYDPLNRTGGDEMRLDTPFDGSGELFTKSKSRYDELQEWIDAEKEALN